MQKCKVVAMVWLWVGVLLWCYHPWASITCQPADAASVQRPLTSNAVQHVVQSLHECGLHATNALRRVRLTNRTVTCNDGSPAGYYIRKSFGSKRWIIFLEGGWYCYDAKSCATRWLRTRNLMTSKLWPEARNDGGILSADPQENPHWWNANHVFVPYCSSDSWSGATFASSTDGFSFLGSLIMDEVIKDLLPQGLISAHRLLLAGSSAGGTGVLLNLDRVASLLRSAGSRARVRGVADSGWFLDNEPYAPLECAADSPTCTAVESIKRGILTWNGQVPDSCRRQQLPAEAWKCYFGYRLYPTMKTPVFIFQWLFDEAQLTSNNVGAPNTKAQWDYIHQVGDHLRRTLRNVSAVFAPSCISHVVLTKRDWRFVRVNLASFPDVLRCWEDDVAPTMHPHHHHHHHHHPHPHPHNHHHFHSGENYMLSDAPGGHSQPRRINVNAPTETSTSGILSTLGQNASVVTKAGNVTRVKMNRKGRKGSKRNKKRHKKGRKNQIRERRSQALGDTNAGESGESTRKCHVHLLDECSWPQCNRACPKLLNPFTGEEMDFIELLKSFGVDMSNVATALGLDLEALNAMGNDKLLQILTQHSRK